MILLVVDMQKCLVDEELYGTMGTTLFVPIVPGF